MNKNDFLDALKVLSDFKELNVILNYDNDFDKGTYSIHILNFNDFVITALLEASFSIHLDNGHLKVTST